MESGVFGIAGAGLGLFGFIFGLIAYQHAVRLEERVAALERSRPAS